MSIEVDIVCEACKEPLTVIWDTFKKVKVLEVKPCKCLTKEINEIEKGV
jgi:hypothetical protein